MSIRRKILAFAAPAALLLLGACATPFRANVSRFQQLPQPAGQTFIVQAADPRLQGGIEFQTYAQQVAGLLVQQGYRQAEGSGDATLIVNLDYGVDGGHEKVVTTPGFGYGGYGPYGGGFGAWGGAGFGRPWGYGGFGRGYYGRRYYSGWADPFWYQPFGYPEVNSYTYFVSHLTLNIRRSADGRTLFEGRARARSLDDSLPHLVPNLIESMFVGFPGRSGEEVQITIPPPPKNGAPAAPPTVSH
jgi:hypothetical protein